MKRVVFVFVVLFFIGCGERAYKKMYAKPSRHIDCLALHSDNPLTTYFLKKEFHFTQDCPFTLKTTSHFIATCTSARAKSLGSDFDGYLRLELLEGNKLLYRNQLDFKGCLKKEDVDTLFKAMKKDMMF